MCHFDRSEIIPPERNGKQYIFPLFFKRVAQAKSFLYNVCCLHSVSVLPNRIPHYEACKVPSFCKRVTQQNTCYKACYPCVTERQIYLPCSKVCFLSGTEKALYHYHFDCSEIALPRCNGKQYIFPSFFKPVQMPDPFRMKEIINVGTLPQQTSHICMYTSLFKRERQYLLFKYIFPLLFISFIL